MTVLVSFALLWAAVYAPAHATTMMTDTLSISAASASDHRVAPCPMSADAGSADHQMHGDGMTHDAMMKGMSGDMFCCPVLALSSADRWIDIARFVIETPIETPVTDFSRPTAPSVDPRPPRG